MPLLEAPFAVLGALAALVWLSERIEALPRIGKLGAATWAILLGALAANLGLLPTSANGHPTYDALFGPGIQLAIFWLLLGVELRALLRVGPALLLLFWIGAASVAIGVPLGLALVGGAESFGERGAGLGAMFVGTYIGGSPNFFALAEIFRVEEQPALVAAATVVDGGMTALWMALGVLLPRWLPSGKRFEASPGANAEPSSDQLRLTDLALLLALGAGALYVAELSKQHSAAALGFTLPPALTLTALALALAQFPAVARLQGARTLGLLLVYLFLVAIGALCDVQALIAAGPTALRMLALVSITFLFHGLCTFGAARLLGWAPELAAIASQANIGGGSSALALARALSRPDLGPGAVLIGALGTASGTWIGLWIGAGWLGGETAG